MCGRYGLTRYPARALEALGVAAEPEAGFVPRFNVAPTQPILVLKAGCSRVEELRWGMIPPWMPEPRTSHSTINARIEGVAGSRLYGEPLISSRCVVFADGWYEWQKRRDGSKQPVWIHRPGGEPFLFAGLWSRWEPLAGSGEPVESVAILTGPASPDLVDVHERMPLTLDYGRAKAWLDPERTDPVELIALLAPHERDEWEKIPVSNRVGNVRFDDPLLIAPLAANLADEAPALF